MFNIPSFLLVSVDFVGSFFMIFFAFLSLAVALRLFLKDLRNILYWYFLGLSFAFASFAISRSVGHILRAILLFLHKNDYWLAIAPFSGAFNTVFIFLATFLTFIFPFIYFLFAKMVKEKEALEKTKKALEEANQRLERFSKELESIVEERTQELAISEEKFRRLFESSGDAIFFCDSEGHLKDINPSGLELFGFAKKEEILGKNLKEFFVNSSHWEYYRSILCSQGKISNFETEILSRDGQKKYVIITANSVEFMEGCQLGCQGIMKDITNIKEMMHRLILSEKMLAAGQLAAGVAHSINTPLGIIYGYTQLLKEQAEQKEMLEDLKIIEEQVKTCQKLISDLLVFARSSSKETRSAFYLHETVGQVSEMLSKSFERRNIKLVLNLKKVPQMWGDEGRIKELIVNLLTNSKDAIQNSGQIYLATRFLPEKGIILEVGDTGSGIAPEIQGKIFEPFFTTKPPGQGTGLGLFVAYAIVKEHGGDIAVYSPPKEGYYISRGIKTLFRITFPVGADNEDYRPSSR